MQQHESDWFPGRVSNIYKDGYAQIKWDSEQSDIAIKGKARESSGSALLQVDETVKAVRTPMGKRTDKTFRHLE